MLKNFFQKIKYSHSVKKAIGKHSLYVIFDRNDRRFFTDYNSADGILMLSQNPVLLIDARYYSAAKNQVKAGVDVLLYNGENTFTDYLKQNADKNVCVDYAKCTAKDYLLVKKAIGRKPGDCGENLELLRAVKTEEQIKAIKLASEITESVYKEAVAEIKEGVTERQIADFIKKRYLEHGAEGEAFETIVAFGKNSAVPHHESSEQVLAAESAVLIDMGAKVNGYCSDFTRTLWFGNEVDKDFEADYFTVLKAHNAAAKKITEGISVKRADAYARNVFKATMQQQYFTHSLGHGVGLDIHEYPYLSPKRKGELKNGYVFTIEPGLYLEDKYGIRTEETYYLSDGKPERFFTEDRYLTVIEPSGKTRKIIRRTKRDAD